jgi:uncharacterized repeat protein (TIGR01451 family)
MKAETLPVAKPAHFPWAATTLTLLLGAAAWLTTPAAFGQAESFTLGTNLVDLSQAPGNETDPSVAINPLNSSALVVVSATDGTVPGLFVWTTTNLGLTWTTNFIATNNDSQGLIAAYGYPSVAWDAYGNLFLAYLPATFEGVAVVVSTNGGRTFSSVTNLAPLDSTDQPRLTAPPFGAAAGSVWVVYKDYTTLSPFTSLQVQGLMSSGLGAIGTFGLAQFVLGSTNGGFADIAVGPLGQVMVAFQDNLQGMPNPSTYPTANIWVSVETNAVAAGVLNTNASFLPAEIVASDAIGGVTYIAAAPTGIGVNAAPGLAWDYDILAPNYDKVYLVYTAVGPNGNAVISFLSSSDYGTNEGELDTNWNGEIYVDDDALTGFNDHFLPRLAVDPISDLVACTWYDCRNDVGAGSMPITNLYTSYFFFTNFTVTNVVFANAHSLGVVSEDWSDTTGNGSNIVISITVDNMYGTGMTNSPVPGKDTNYDIYVGYVKDSNIKNNANIIIGLEGTNTNNVTVTVYLTNLFTRGYTTGFAGNTEAIPYATVSFDGGESFLANQQLPSAPEVILAPAQGIASDDVEQFTFSLQPVGSDSVTGWGHYAALACYGANFFPVWMDNSDVTTNNPDGANGNFDLYTLTSGPGRPGFVVPTSDLTIWVTNSPSPVISEGVIVYTVVVTNKGPNAAAPVTVTDLLSPYVTLESVIPALGGTSVVSQTTNGQQVVMTWPILGTGGVLTSTIRVTATTSAIDTNLATVSSPYINLSPSSASNRLVFVVDGQDLAVGMTTSATNVLIGDTVVTWVTVTNLGPSTNGPVFITNVFSPNWTNVAVQAQGTNLVTNTPSGFMAIVNVGLLPTNKPVTAIFTAVATSAGTLGDDTYAFQNVTVYSQDVDTNLANNNAGISYFINGEDLVMGMTSSSPSVDQGEPITFTLNLTNFGPSYSGLVTVMDTLSANLSPLSVTQSQGTKAMASNQVVFSLGTLGAGQIATLTVTAVAATGPPSTFDLAQAPFVTNVATVFSTDFNTNPANNEVTNIIPINGEDLAIGMAPSSPTADQGEPITFTMSVTNFGPSYSGVVTVIDTLSSNLTPLSAVQSQGTNTMASNQIVFSLGAIGAGQAAILRVTALAPSGPPSTVALSQAPLVTNFAEVFSTDFDTNLANNVVTNIIPVNREHLVIGMTPSRATADQGEPITYTVKVANVGPSYSGLVTVTNTLSTNLSYLSATQSQGTNSIASNQVVFSLGALGAGQVALLTVTAVAPSGPPSTLALSQAPSVTNFATVFSTDFDTNLANNSFTSVETVNVEHLGLGMTSSSATADQGEPITYTTYVTNFGPSYSGLVTVTNILSTNLSHLSATQSQGTNSMASNQVVFSLGALGAGQVALLTVTAVAPSGPPSTLALSQAPSVTNFATVFSTDFDTNLANNAAASVETVNVEHLGLGLFSSSPSVNLGESITFTMNVTNFGPSYSGLITVTNALSTNLGPWSATQSQGTSAIAGNQVVFSLGALEAGQVATLTVLALALSGPPSATDFASVSSTDFDTNLDNNAATSLVTINGEDLAIGLTASPASLQVGQTVTFRESVTNLGLATNGVVLVTNTFSTNLGPITVLQPATGYTINAGVVTFNLGTLNAGQTVPLTIIAIASGAGAGTAAAVAGSQDFDTNIVNNTASAAVSITYPAISNLVVTPLASSAFIVFDISTAAKAQVRYGLTTNYGSFSAVSATPATHHVVLLTGLTGGTNYDFAVLAFVGTTTLTTAGSFSTTNTLILNTADARYAGAWNQGTIATGIYDNGYYQYSAATNLPVPTVWAIYDPFIPAAGLYDVSIWYPANPSFTTNAQVYIAGSTNEIIRSLNQTVNGGAWLPLATNMYFDSGTNGAVSTLAVSSAPPGTNLHLASGTNGAVILYNNTGETNRFVVANAMMWVYDAAQDDPANGAIPAWWANFYFGANVNGYVNGSAVAANGYSIYANYVFGTDPTTNAASRLSFTVTPAASNALFITFSPCQGGRNYQLQTAANLSNPVWNTLTNGFILNTNGSGTFSVTQPNSAGAFYRLSGQIIP